MTFTEQANQIFKQAIRDYHLKDHVDTPINNPYKTGTIEHSLYLKCWIDTVQWHLEDIIRDPHIDPAEALGLKRRIDRSNQDRTDLVEEIDSYFRQTYSEVKSLPEARLNTESPAWAVDRLSILALKIWHMQRRSVRTLMLLTCRSVRPSSTYCSNSKLTSRRLSTSCWRISRLDANT